jgi:hypothetical protein
MRGRPSKNASVSIPAAVALRATPWAILCRVRTERGGFECWVPLSQLDEQSEVRAPGDHGTLVVSRWWFEVSRTDQQFRAQDLKASESKRSQPARSSTRLEDISGFRQNDFDFIEEHHREEPPANAPIEITDEDLPF